MKSTMKFIMFLSMVFAIAISSCSTEDGADGQDGADGAQGVAGMDGQDGADGEDGNANVIASDWIPTDFEDVATPFNFFDVNDPNLSQEIVDNGLVLAFGRIGNSAVSIPFTFSNRTYYIALFPETNEIRFIGVSLDGTNETFNDIEFVRYVIIPSNAAGKTTTKNELETFLETQGVDINDYNQLKAYYSFK